MALTETPDTVRAEIAVEREQLVDAVQSMRAATDLTRHMRAKLPVVALAAFGVAFVIGGGVGATMRLVFRRGREGRERFSIGRFALVDRS